VKYIEYPDAKMAKAERAITEDQRRQQSINRTLEETKHERKERQ